MPFSCCFDSIYSFIVLINRLFQTHFQTHSSGSESFLVDHWIWQTSTCHQHDLSITAIVKQWFVGIIINTYSLKQPDLYYFETIKMTSQAWSNFAWRIRAAGEYSLWTLTRLVKSFAWFQNSIDQAVSWNKCFIIHRTTPKIMPYVATLRK